MGNYKNIQHGASTRLALLSNLAVSYYSSLFLLYNVATVRFLILISVGVGYSAFLSYMPPSPAVQVELWDEL